MFLNKAIFTLILFKTSYASSTISLKNICSFLGCKIQVENQTIRNDNEIIESSTCSKCSREYLDISRHNIENFKDKLLLQQGFGTTTSKSREINLLSRKNNPYVIISSNYEYLQPIRQKKVLAADKLMINLNGCKPATDVDDIKSVDTVILNFISINQFLLPEGTSAQDKSMKSNLARKFQRKPTIRNKLSFSFLKIYNYSVNVPDFLDNDIWVASVILKIPVDTTLNNEIFSLKVSCNRMAKNAVCYGEKYNSFNYFFCEPSSVDQLRNEIQRSNNLNDYLAQKKVDELTMRHIVNK